MAYWNADYSQAFVYVFIPNNGSGARLSAGVWEQVHRQVKGGYLITDPPNQYDFLIYPSSLEQMAPATWSPDGEQVAFFTARNEVVLMDLAGQTQLLASQVGLGRSNFTRLLAWSPDGSRLFVSDRGTASMGCNDS